MIYLIYFYVNSAFVNNKIYVSLKKEREIHKNLEIQINESHELKINIELI